MNPNITKLSETVDILYHLFHGKKLAPYLDQFDDEALVDFQKFMWEKTVEFGIISRGKDFDRKEITHKMVPTALYKKQRNCLEEIYNCKGTHCITKHPECARNKIKEHIEIMAESIWEYVNKDEQIQG
jgi:hypothetical protein